MARIAITGGSGLIGRTISPLLRQQGHWIRSIDIVEQDPALADDQVEASVLDEETLVSAFAGMDAVVHLAGHPSERPWRDILTVNIDGTHKVLEACVATGVPRVLLASSIHAVGYETAAATRHLRVLPPRPDTYYGVGKVAAEALGSVFADRHGLTVVSARICTFADHPSPGRTLATWLSPADTTRLVNALLHIETPGHRVVWGVSNNEAGWFSLDEGKSIGFQPKDDAARWAVEAIGDVDFPDDHQPFAGVFVDDGHQLGGTW